MKSGAGSGISPLRLRLAWRSPAGFALAALGIRRPEEWWPADHHLLMDHHLVDMALGRSPRLLMHLPPRHGKSVLLCRWLAAWWLARHPEQEVMILCSTADLAEVHAGAARDILLQHGESFFGIQVRGGERAPSSGWQLVGHRGICHAMGTHGTVVGKGAHLMIVDDPIKGEQEAYSSTQRDKLWTWWTDTAESRLNPRARQVIMFQRWHHDDLAGRLLEHEPDRWRQLCLPAIAGEDDPLGRDPGEALWPEMYPINELEAKRRKNPHTFQSLYQQDPSPVEGAIYTRERFHYARDKGTYVELLGPMGVVDERVGWDQCMWFATADFATRTSTHNDYTAVGIFAWTPSRRLIVVHIARGKWPLGEQWPKIKQVAAAFPRVAWIAGELRGAGHGAFAAAAAEGVDLRPLKSDIDKGLRAMPSATAYEGGRIYHLEATDWLPEFERELILFPSAKHDDQVDVLANGWLQMQESGVDAVMASVDPDGTVRRTYEVEEEETPETVAVGGDTGSAPIARVVPRQRRKRWFER